MTTITTAAAEAAPQSLDDITARAYDLGQQAKRDSQSPARLVPQFIPVLRELEARETAGGAQ